MTSTRCDAAVLRARSADAVLLDRLRTPGADGRVDTVFRHVINVLTVDGQLIALASRSNGDAPWTLVVDVEDWSGSAVEAGQVVRFGVDSVLLPAPEGELRIDTRVARRWNPIPVSLAHLGTDHLAVATRALDHLLRSHGVPGGMLAGPPDAPPMDAAVGRALAAGRDAFVHAVTLQDDAGTCRAVLGLLGLGPGLTPAGDDFLTGPALLSSLTGSRLRPFARTLAAVLGDHPGRTTTLSLTTLREALAGRVREPWPAVLHALAATAGRGEAQVTETLRNPVRRALAIGHTSGTDTLSGLLTGLHLERELRGSL
ncbi:oxamate carbamoyltransferase subunit AllH family protein [Streptomyces sp. NPDC055663]